MKLGQLLEDYLNYLEIERGRSLKTRENYEHYLRRFLTWARIEHAAPRMITDEIVRSYRLWLNRFTDERGRALGRTTQNYHMIALRGFLKYCARRGIETLPAERIELSSSPDREIDFLEPQEVARLLAAPRVDSLEGLRDRAILEMLFSTGLRVSEIISLNRGDINMRDAEGVRIRGKGNKLRLVFLSDEARRALKAYTDKRTDIDEALFARTSRSKKVPTAGDLRLTARSIQRLVKKYAAAAGITKDVHPHTLRHSFATDLLRNGADIRSVQVLLGHTNITTTQIYTHVTDRQLHETHRLFHARRRKKDITGSS